MTHNIFGLVKEFESEKDKCMLNGALDNICTLICSGDLEADPEHMEQLEHGCKKCNKAKVILEKACLSKLFDDEFFWD